MAEIVISINKTNNGIEISGIKSCDVGDSEVINNLVNKLAPVLLARACIEVSLIEAEYKEAKP